MTPEDQKMADETLEALTSGEDMKLKEKAIKIKGNDYVLVSDRVIFFNLKYPNGCIQTKLLSQPSAERVVVKAKVTPDVKNPEKYFTGLSQAKWGEGMVNTTAALENAETSAVGRALGMMGIGVIDSVASADEMSKAGVKQEPRLVPDHTQKQLIDQPCKNCGGKMALSAKGNIYCTNKCWLKN